MNKMQEMLAEQPEEVKMRMRNLALIVNDPKSNALDRMAAALELGDIGGPMIIESLRRECEPRFEYRFIRGAKVKVRVN